MHMTPRKLSLILACLVTTGCPHDTHFMRMEEQLNRYGAAIRWGSWETASDFQPPAKRGRLDLAYLNKVRVTSYNPVYRQEHEGSDVISQNVEIRYYFDQTGVEKAVMDRQTWRFDNEKSQWFLLTGLPDFR